MKKTDAVIVEPVRDTHCNPVIHELVLHCMIRFKVTAEIPFLELIFLGHDLAKASQIILVIGRPVCGDFFIDVADIIVPGFPELSINGFFWEFIGDALAP